MGLSIHYSGTIKHINLIPALVDEVNDICTALNWNCTIINNDELNGIIFSPEKCEPLFFTFSKNRKLYSPALLQYNIEPATIISVKTQYAGIDAHIAVIKLLKHLGTKYFSDFNVYDEGKYWETGDEQILQQQFNNYDAAINFVAGTLKNFKVIKSEAPQSLVERIAKLIKKFRNNNLIIDNAKLHSTTPRRYCLCYRKHKPAFH